MLEGTTPGLRLAIALVAVATKMMLYGEVDASRRRLPGLRLVISLLVAFLPVIAGVATTGQTTAGETQEDRQAARYVRGRAVGDDGRAPAQVAPHNKATGELDVKDCILLFGAFCNGNMGDVVQPIAMEHLLSSFAPPGQCFYYAHPRGENHSKGSSIGEFFGGDRLKLIGLSSDTAWMVNRFKAFVIGGGGIFAAQHAPLFRDIFAEAVAVPIVVMGVGANYHAKEYSTLLQKAVFVSGRDTPSIERFAGILGDASTPAVRPDGVRLVRDPVLSDQAFTDTDGTCWRQSSGDHHQPLCFVLPAANSFDTVEMNRQLATEVVRRGDRFINVFPKHQEELAQFEYPGTVEEILDPMEYVRQLCSCKAIISTRFHGAILGLHMGVPTFGAFHLAAENKVPDLMIDTMSLPDQFLLIDGNFTREVVDRQVDTVRHLYELEGRRGAIHDKLSVFYEEFQAEARHVMYDVVGVPHQQPEQQKAEFAQPSLSFGGGSRQLPKKAGGGSFSVKGDTAAGEDYVIAIFLLFTIAGLAIIPSATGGGGRGKRQGGHETAAAVCGDDRPSSRGGQDNGASRSSCVQEGADARSGRSPERGVLPKRSAAKSPESSPLRPRFGPNIAAPDEAKPSTVVFALNFVLWIALAVAFSSYSKSYLRDTHDPVGLLALQGLVGSLVLSSLGRLGLGASDSPSPSDASRKIHGLRRLQTELTTASRRETLVAVLHSGQAFLTNFSLFVGGVAVTNALKAMEPVAAAVFSYFLLGKKVAPANAAAFAIIVAGIVLLTSKATGGGGAGGNKDEGEATHTGASRILMSAAFTMAAVSCNALRNVVIKKGDPIPPHRTLFTCSVAAGVIGVTLMLVRSMIRSMDRLLLGGDNGVLDDAAQYGPWLSMDGVNAAICFVGYNFASFNLLARLSPVGHAVGNSVKRVVIFGSGIVLLGEVMTVRQLTGAAMALVGVGVYNVAGKRK